MPAIDPEVPVSLLLDELEKNPAYQILMQRVLVVRDSYMRKLIAMPEDADLGVIQRNLGVMQGLNRILAEPDLFQRDWERATDTKTHKSRATTR